MSTAGSLTLHEYDVIVPASSPGPTPGDAHAVPDELYAWLEGQSLDLIDRKLPPWVRRCRHGVQVTSHVGVVRAPSGLQIEILPKIGKALDAGASEARGLLLRMLRCLQQFSHLRFGNAQLAADNMPLLDVFVGEFLRTVVAVARSGIRGQYQTREDDLPALRGRLLVAQHLRRNLVRADRFHTAHDEFSTNRPENRLIHTALRKVLGTARVANHQRLVRELLAVFAEVPVSHDPDQDMQRVQLDRNMRTYREALDWTRLILQALSPTSAMGVQRATSLLFPMERLFEAYVAKHFQKQLPEHLALDTQVRRHHLVHHGGAKWFELRPDMVVSQRSTDVLVLDTKWKLLDAGQNNGTNKYGLQQDDFYQLHAYGRSYLGGRGVVALVYPRTDKLDRPLPVFDFPGSEGLQLWVLPFCLKQAEVLLPQGWEWPEDGLAG
ncbi:McrC family protein [Stenotrophomonas maltophilia]|uniref:2-keto-D-gluconate dehydrogenase n=1 Tax=Stenotrophomonas maltophilia TaxID=40324 RepID=A0A431UIW7_STEMA|nr:McrC family protein [Stenotrophomonas maltophilia]RTQ89644.1 2-keto-D-gluconate dehydrogenase [Stenotrophomonas maltophilia]